MAGDPAQTQRQPRSTEARDASEWYAVTGDGASALRIAAGLTVGESADGELALDDPQPPHQWISFDIAEGGQPRVTIATRERSLVVDGTTHLRYTLDDGATVKLPHHNLYISRDTSVPATSGTTVEVVAREVPGRPQDLVAPGWQEALRTVQKPAEGPAAEGLRAPEGARVGATDTQPAAARPAPDRTMAPPRDDYADLDVTVPESRRGAGRRRSRQRSATRNLVLYGLAGAIAVALAAALLTGTWPMGEERAQPSSVPFATPSDTTGDADDSSASQVATPAPAQPSAASGQTSSASGQTSSASGQTSSASGQTSSASGQTSAQESPAPTSSVSGQERYGAPGEPAPAAASVTSGDVAASEAEAPSTPPAPPPADAATGQTQVADVLAGQAPAAMEQAPAATEQAPAATERAPAAAERAPAAAERAAATDAPVVAEQSPAVEPAPASGGQPSGAAPAAAGGTGTADDLDWRLIRARELLESGYITFPPEDNAVAYLKRMLAADPANPRAQAMLEESASRLIDAAVRAHDQGLDYQARNTLEEVLGFAPEHEQANRLWRQWVSAGR